MEENALLVLVVEDNPDDEHVTLRGLRRCDVSVTTRVAHDGEEALDILGLAGGEPWTPHLVLSDLKMPRVRGDELLERCRVDPRLADVPFVVMSSSAERQDVERCLTLGASEYAVKPVGYDEYLASVCALAKRWLVKG